MLIQKDFYAAAPYLLDHDSPIFRSSYLFHPVIIIIILRSSLLFDISCISGAEDGLGLAPRLGEREQFR